MQLPRGGPCPHRVPGKLIDWSRRRRFFSSFERSPFPSGRHLNFRLFKPTDRPSTTLWFSTPSRTPNIHTMFGPFRFTNPLRSGLLWKTPWRLSKFQKRRQRHRLRAVDSVVATLENALASKGETLKAVERWRAEMPKEEEMLPKDKYTIFDRKEKRYRKGIHSMLRAPSLYLGLIWFGLADLGVLFSPLPCRIAKVDEGFPATEPPWILDDVSGTVWTTRLGASDALPPPPVHEHIGTMRQILKMEEGQECGLNWRQVRPNTGTMWRSAWELGPEHSCRGGLDADASGSNQGLRLVGLVDSRRCVLWIKVDGMQFLTKVPIENQCKIIQQFQSSTLATRNCALSLL